MPRARRAALLGGGVSVYADLNFAAARYKVGTSSAGDLTALPGFTFTRASLAMGYDATGKLTYGPNNLATQSQSIVGGTGAWVSNSSTQTNNFIAAPDGTVTATRIVVDGTTINQGIYLNNLSVPGRLDVFSVWLRGAVGGELVWIGDATSRYQATLTTSWQRFTNPGHAMVSNHNVIYALNNTAMTFYAWGAQLEAVTYQTTPSTYYPTTTAAYYGPRLVYDPVTLASQGILVEEARTNLCLQSQDFATTWAASRSSVTVNTTTSPDGTTNADKLVEDNTAGGHQLTQTITTTAVATTVSVYAKPAGRDWIALGLNDSGASGRLVYFNVSTGAVGTVGTGFTASIQAVGNGWYRCIATLSVAFAGANTLRVYVTTGDGVTSYTGDGTSGLFLWQAQLEAGTGASSPIPTTTASVTRAADVPNNTGLTVASESTVVIEWMRYPFSAATFPRLFTITDGTSNNLKAVYGSGGNLWSQATVGGASQGDVLAGSGQVADTGYKLATRWAVGSRRSALNGTLGTLGTADIASAGLTQMHIGCALSGTTQLNGTISRIRIYNRALSDAQLQSLTT